ncbi:MAG: aminotransferase class I/II-fold pyridoxal phosphate-dependent enzyme, partial [Planctomycetota bacterium]
YLPMTAENNFVPTPPPEDGSDGALDLVYLCSPNNPTGAAATKDELAAWVAYANRHGSILLYDAAYADFIHDPSLPKSIYEVDGARDCAIEMRSLSKTAGFTGTRCGYVVIPKTLERPGPDGKPVSLHALWSRRQSTKFNGVGYVVQRGAEAAYSEAGRAQCQGLIDGYMQNAASMRKSLTEAGLSVYGGENAPYVWVGCPDGADSWGFFDQLLKQAHVVGTPGAGFGSCGEGYIRFSAFNSLGRVEEAMSRVVAQLGVAAGR